MSSAAICIICLVPYSEELEIVSLNCHHCFHRNCIKEWLKIRRDCPQCRRKVNPKQVYRVILSFETDETIKFPSVTNDYVVADKSLSKRQETLINDLKQQIKSKDTILEEKEAEIQRVRFRLSKLSSTKKHEAEIQDLVDQLKVKDAIINQSLNDVKEIERMLLDLEVASKEDAKQKEQTIVDLSLRLKMSEHALSDLLRKQKVQETESDDKVKELKEKLKEAMKEAQTLRSQFLQISSIVDEFKLEQTFKSFKSPTNSSNNPEICQLTVDDMLL